MTGASTRIAMYWSAGLLLAVSANAATLTVTSGADSGPGTLRQAIIDASAGSTITFAAGISSVILTSGRLAISKNLTIAGPGPKKLAIGRSTDITVARFRIFDISAGTVTISGVTITNGGGDSGINIYNHGGNLTIESSTISDGHGIGSGGGILNGCGAPGCSPSNSVLTINNSTISGNTADTGAGICVYGSNTSTTIANSTISGNRAYTNYGGGMYIDSGPVLITGSTISGNIAQFQGGGISMPGAAGSLVIRNSTITGNSVLGVDAISYGGGINSAINATTLGSTIVAKNVAPLAPDFNGPMHTEGFNLIGDASSMGYPISHPADQFGVDPLLGPLQDNGGPTFTHALLSGSPAIDRGIANGFILDQRGFARTVDGATPNAPSGGDGSDIGAYEVQADILPGCANINRIVQNGNDSGTDSLRDVISKVCAGSTITFAPAVTAVTLTSAELVINKSLNISGPGANLLTVQRSAAVGTPNFRLFNLPSGIVVAISGLTLANGNTSTSSGGAIRNAGTLTLTGVAVAGNAATLGGNGGGIYNNFGTLTINASTISGNSVSSSIAASGGGIFNSGGAVTLVNSTLSGNSAVGPGGNSDSGGGIFSNVGTVRLINSTITGNSGDLGGGVRGLNGAVITARNTIIALNTSGSGPDVNGPLTSEGFNLIGDITLASIAPAQFSDQLTVTAGQLNLGPLQPNGGPTPTHALLAGSFALDKGHSGGYATDQRGRPRPFDQAAIANATGGDGSDIGAFEFSNLSLDIDGNGTYDALTDGLMILRYLFGLTGTSLTSGAIGLSPVRSTPADILAYLDSIKPALDLDGNGTVDALTDGLMALRYLFGLRGSSMSSGALGVGFTRAPAQIETYIQTLMP